MGFGLDDTREILRSTRILKSLPDDDIAFLAARCHDFRVAAGTRVFAKEEFARDVYWVIEGRIKLSVTARTGHELFFTTAEAGGWFGEVSAIEGGPRYADATALADCHLLALDRRPLTEILENRPRALAEVVRLLCGHLRHSAANIETVTLQSASMRIWGRIVDLAHRYPGEPPPGGGIRIEHGLSQQELADSVALTRVMVNRQLAEWRAHGLVETGRGVIVVPDPVALEAFVWSDPR